MKTPQVTAGAMALAIPIFAFAQASATDPAASTPSAPQLRFQSAFADYKPYQDISAAHWRQLNDTVRDAAAKSGGAHSGNDSATPAAPAAPAMPMRNHGDHRSHGSKP